MVVYSASFWLYLEELRRIFGLKDQRSKIGIWWHNGIGYENQNHQCNFHKKRNFLIPLGCRSMFKTPTNCQYSFFPKVHVSTILPWCSSKKAALKLAELFIPWPSNTILFLETPFGTLLKMAWPRTSIWWWHRGQLFVMFGTYRQWPKVKTKTLWPLPTVWNLKLQDKAGWLILCGKHYFPMMCIFEMYLKCIKHVINFFIGTETWKGAKSNRLGRLNNKKLFLNHWKLNEFSRLSDEKCRLLKRTILSNWRALPEIYLHIHNQ